MTIQTIVNMSPFRVIGYNIYRHSSDIDDYFCIDPIFRCCCCLDRIDPETNCVCVCLIINRFDLFYYDTHAHTHTHE